VRASKSEVSDDGLLIIALSLGLPPPDYGTKFDHVHIISRDPEASTNWYVEMFGATITAITTARGAPQIFVELGGMTISYVSLRS
jgi:hypothetical protein